MRHLVVTDSDIIQSVAFDPGDEVDALVVIFKSQPTVAYRYENVTPDSFTALISAKSIGEEFHKMFRKTKYPFTKSDVKATLKK
jgi:hypothetical protein